MLWPQKHVLALLGSIQNTRPLSDLNAFVILSLVVAVVALFDVLVLVLVVVVVFVAVVVVWLCCAI